MIIQGRSISPGKAEGIAITYPEPFSFLGGVNGSTGDFNVRGGNIADKVFLFPAGKGSTVGSYVVYDLKVHGKAPAAIVNTSAETIVTTGAVISSVPMVDGVDVSIVWDGDRVLVDGDAGTMELPDVEVRDTVSSMLVMDGKILMLKRPEDAHSFPGKWSLVSGSIEDGEVPLEAARREVFEETGLKMGYPDGSLPHFHVREGNTVWRVHPILFCISSGEINLNRENVSYRWIPAEDVDVDLVEGVEEIVEGFSKAL